MSSQTMESLGSASWLETWMRSGLCARWDLILEPYWARRITGKQPHFIDEDSESKLGVSKKGFTLAGAVISWVSQLRHTQGPG